MKIKKYGNLHRKIDVQPIEIKIKGLPSEFDGFRIAQVSDVHLRGVTLYTNYIINTVEKQRPDIIVISGDAIENYEVVKTSGLHEMLVLLAKTAPCYAVTGNHELRGGDINYWADIYRRAGVTPLDNSYTILQRGRGRIALMGLGGNTQFDKRFFPETLEFSHMPKLLLSHRPEYWLDTLDKCGDLRPDIIFSGHAHGGQVRLPFIGGIYAPGQGFFPRYTSGVHYHDGTALVVSRGLTSPFFPPRINNAPHLPLVILRK